MLAWRCFLDPRARISAEIVEMTQPALSQQIVDDQTSITAKSFFGFRERFIRTRQAAVKATRARRRLREGRAVAFRGFLHSFADELLVALQNVALKK